MSLDTDVYDKQLAWKLHGQRKLAIKLQELDAQQERDCTFSPKTNTRVPRAPDYSVTGDVEEGNELNDVNAAKTEAALLHPTESQETSIQAHLARQGRAREQALEAQLKLNGAQQSKDFNKVTTVEPFALSTTNWKPRQSTIESPTPAIVDEERQSRHTSKVGAKVRPKAKARASSKSPLQITHTSRSAGSSTKEEVWESERTTLVSIIDAQRQELALRGQAQQEAVRVAERFATATQAFEERLIAVEQSALKELEEVKRLLASQAAAMDLILTSLGITRRPGSSSNS